MTDRNIPTLVLGEAPESDDDDLNYQENMMHNIYSKKNTDGNASPVVGKEIIGEAHESDDEVELHNTHALHDDKCTNTRKENIMNIISKINPNSLKKLQERNGALYDSLTSFKKQILNSTNYELSNVNQQLLKVQIELQQTLTNIRFVKSNLNEYQKKLNNIVLADYIPAINIRVPSHII